MEMTPILMLLVANMSRRRLKIVAPLWAIYRVLLILLVDLRIRRDLARRRVVLAVGGIHACHWQGSSLKILV